jgi:hypothetical protein
MPIDKVVSILDAVMASRPNRKWDVDGVRSALVVAAENGFVETGTAKRILHAASPWNTLLPGGSTGMGRIIQLWNGLKTIDDASRPSEALLWRKGLGRVIEKTLSDGLVAIRMVAHPRYRGIGTMNEETARVVGALADGLHNLPDALARQDATSDPIVLGSIRADLARARRAIAHLRSMG